MEKRKNGFRKQRGRDTACTWRGGYNASHCVPVTNIFIWYLPVLQVLEELPIIVRLYLITDVIQSFWVRNVISHIQSLFIWSRSISYVLIILTNAETNNIDQTVVQRYRGLTWLILCGSIHLRFTKSDQLTREILAYQNGRALMICRRRSKLHILELCGIKGSVEFLT